VRRVAFGLPLLLLSTALLSGCWGWNYLELPSEPGDQTMVLVIESGADPQYLVYDLSQPVAFEAQLAKEQTAVLHAYFYTGTLNALGLTARQLSPAPEGTSQGGRLPRGATEYRFERAPGAGYAEGWQRVGAVDPLPDLNFLELGGSSLAHCQTSVKRLNLPLAGDSVSFVLPNAGHALVGAGSFQLYDVTIDGVENVPFGPSAIAAYSQSADRLWIGGAEGELSRIDPSALSEPPFIAVARGGYGWVTALSGGLVDGKIELVAVSHLDEILFYQEGSDRWQRFDLSGELPACYNPQAIDTYGPCRARRVLWLGPREALVTGRGPWLGHFVNGSYEQLTITGCDQFSAVLPLEREGPVVICQSPGREQWFRFADRNDPKAWFEGQPGQTTFDMSSIGNAVVSVGSNGAFGQRGPAYLCDPTSLSVDDLGYVAAVDGKNALVGTFVLDDLTANMSTNPGALFWISWPNPP